MIWSRNKRIVQGVSTLAIDEVPTILYDCLLRILRVEEGNTRMRGFEVGDRGGLTHAK